MPASLVIIDKDLCVLRPGPGRAEECLVYAHLSMLPWRCVAYWRCSSGARVVANERAVRTLHASVCVKCGRSTIARCRCMLSLVLGDDTTFFCIRYLIICESAEI